MRRDGLARAERAIGEEALVTALKDGFMERDGKQQGRYIQEAFDVEREAA